MVFHSMFNRLFSPKNTHMNISSLPYSLHPNKIKVSYLEIIFYLFFCINSCTYSALKLKFLFKMSFLHFLTSALPDFLDILLANFTLLSLYSNLKISQHVPDFLLKNHY